MLRKLFRIGISLITLLAGVLPAAATPLVINSVAVFAPGIALDDFRAPRRVPASALDPKFAAMIGQMIMVGFAGDAVGNAELKRLRGMIVDGRIGGVMLFGRNLKSRKQVAALTEFLSPKEAALLPLIAIDQEGGKVQRLGRKLGYQYVPSAHRVAGSLNLPEAEIAYRGMARELKHSGFNMNFGPVVDVNVNPNSPVIGRVGRSFSGDPEQVISYATGFMRAHQRMAVLTVAKHFPGHGSARVDSHRGFTDIADTWSDQELVPFRGLIAAGVDMVMTGHLYHPKFSDGPDVPASLSKRAVTKSLRYDLGFKGVAITDDLQMRAIEKNRTLEQVVVLAVNAGNDILLYGNDLHNTRRAFPALVRARSRTDFRTPDEQAA